MLPVAFVLVWSSGYLAGTIGAHSGLPLALLFWRFLLAFLMLGVVAVITRAQWPTRPSTYLHLLVTGILLQTLQFGPLYLVPPVTALLAFPVLGQTMTATVLVGMAVSAIGVLMALFAKRGAESARGPVPEGAH